MHFVTSVMCRLEWLKMAALPDMTKSYVHYYLFIIQAFSDYQIQQMTANFVDQFGFNDEEFSEHDENIKWVSVLTNFCYFNSVCLCLIIISDPSMKEPCYFVWIFRGLQAPPPPTPHPPIKGGVMEDDSSV